LGTPRGRYDEHSSKFFPQKETKVCQSRKKSILQKVMLGSLVTLQQGAVNDNVLARLQLVATWNLHTTQPSTLFSTYDEVVNLTGLLEIKGMSASSGKQ
jgi:hypothetical protein